MEKVIVILCDIYGTIEGDYENNQIDYINFNNNILNLEEINSVNYALFSLVSTEKKEIVKEQNDILINFFDKSIINNRFYFENGYVENDNSVNTISGKVFQIKDYISELSNKFEIEKIYFIDDSDIYHRFLQMLDISWNNKVEHIIPKERLGLKEVNKLLNEYQNKKAKI